MTRVTRGRWQPSLGAVPDEVGGTRFRVWAPKPSKLELILQGADGQGPGGGQRVIELENAEHGYRQAHVSDTGVGTRYGYRIDGEGPYPDPCSRSQPDGVHGLSEVLDASAFAWTDDAWIAPEFADLVLYECHIGTLTTEGTFDAAATLMAELRGIGFTAVELMPIATFPGRWNWGYDGTQLFAPAAVYGGPDGLRRLVNAAHEANMAVVLDVVYNHFGPDGNYTGLYADEYLSSVHTTPWGPAVNFDGPGSPGVRTFVIENLLHWAHEYHIDGFRLDATHQLIDSSAHQILPEIASTLRTHSRTVQPPYLMAETPENDVRYATPLESGGYGFDAVWADDFHHGLHTALFDDRAGYFVGFDGSMLKLADTVRHGFLYEGEFDAGADENRGTPARRWPWPAFLYCLQNHDQVGNRPFGDRMNNAASRADTLAATMLLLLLPQTPLVFQGQEFLASTPFLYFTDHPPKLGRQVTKGRRRDFAQFKAFEDEGLRESIPDPQDPLTFERSRLNHDEAKFGLGMLAVDYHRRLLEIRATDPVLRAYRGERCPIETKAAGSAILVRFTVGESERWLAVNFGAEAAFQLSNSDQARIFIHTNESRFGGTGGSPEVRQGVLTVPAYSAVFVGAGPD